MELFGVVNGKVYFATGSTPDEKELRKITAAVANTLLDSKLSPKKEKKPPQLSYEQREKSFIWRVQQWKDKNPNKYPLSFYSGFLKYWTEGNGKKMRFEEEKFFEIGKRLAYSWGTRTEKQKSDYWMKDKLQAQ